MKESLFFDKNSSFYYLIESNTKQTYVIQSDFTIIESNSSVISKIKSSNALKFSSFPEHGFTTDESLISLSLLLPIPADTMTEELILSCNSKHLMYLIKYYYDNLHLMVIDPYGRFNSFRINQLMFYLGYQLQVQKLLIGLGSIAYDTEPPDNDSVDITTLLNVFTIPSGLLEKLQNI